MAKRIKKSGMKFLLDLHYSNTWADPGRQNIPIAWKDPNFQELTRKVYEYTTQVLKALKDRGTMPDMVQTGNEINHGILWSHGKIQHPDSLATLLKAALSAVKILIPTLLRCFI